MLCPAQKYRASEKQYIEKLPQIEYLPGDEIKKVNCNGVICFEGKKYQLGRPLRGEYVALRQIGENEWAIYYVNSRLCRFRSKV